MRRCVQGGSSAIVRSRCPRAKDNEARRNWATSPEPVDLVFTDPPYNVPIDGHVSGLGAVRHREFAMASGEMSTAQFTGFLKASARRRGTPRF
jgi:DNA modification methylase